MNWSRYNITRALELIRKRKMTEAGLKVLPPDVISRAEKQEKL